MEEKILTIVKTRLNMLDDALDEYLSARVNAAIDELNDTGIHLRDVPRDIVFAADYVCWQYANREKKESMPEWLRLMRRERWLAERDYND